VNIDEFQQLADAWGGRTDLWPADRRAAAAALAASDPAAARALEAARALDGVLATATGLPASAALRARIAATAPGQGSRRATRRWLGALGAGAALAAACAAGAVTGVAAATRQALPARASAVDPADDAARFLAEPTDPAAS
jgi:hypothetical protein